MRDIFDLDGLVDYLKLAQKNFVLKGHQDFVVLVCGYEGAGKSSLAHYLARQIDPNFSMKDITFSISEYLARQKDIWNDGWSKKRGGAIIWDEGGQGLSRKYMTEENIKLVQSFIGNRALELFHFDCIPKPYSMDKYVREDRTQIILFCYFDLEDDFSIGDRYAAVITRPSIGDMLKKHNWYMDFYNSKDLIRASYVDAVFKLPDIPAMFTKAEIRSYEKLKHGFVNQCLTFEEKKAPKKLNKHRGLFWKKFERDLNRGLATGKSKTEIDKKLGKEYNISPRQVRFFKKELREIRGE